MGSEQPRNFKIPAISLSSDAVKILGAALVLSIVVWVIDVAVHTYFFIDENFLDYLILNPDIHMFYDQFKILASFLAFGLLFLFVSRQRTQFRQRLEQYNRVLDAMRRINQAVAHDNNPKTLLNQICQELTRSGVFQTAWIARMKNGSIAEPIFHSGFGDQCDPMIVHLQEDPGDFCHHLGDCTGQVMVICDPPNECGDCPLAQVHSGNAALGKCLRYQGVDNGWLYVSVPQSIAQDADLHNLFSETCDDIAAALWSHDVEAEREQMNATLQEREEQFRVLFDHAGNGITVVSTDGTIKYFNQRAAWALGYDHDEFRQLTVFDLVSTIQTFEQFQAIAEKITADQPYTFESRMRRKDGSTLAVEATVSKLEVQGETQYVAVTRDITFRKRAEEERELTLRLMSEIQQADNLKSLLQQISAILQEWTACQAVGIRLKTDDDYPYLETRGFDESYIDAVNFICQSSEASSDANLNKIPICLCGDVLRGHYDTSLDCFTENGSFYASHVSEQVQECQYQEWLKQGGNKIRNQCLESGFESIALIPLRQGDMPFGLIQLNDPSPHHFTMEQIHTLERVALQIAMGIRQLRTADHVRELLLWQEELVRSANIGLWDWDLPKNEVWYSPEWKQQIGYEDSEISNSFDEWRQRVHPDDLDPALDTINRFLEERPPKFESEFRLQHKDGSYRWILAQGSLLSGPDGEKNRMVGSHIDITRLKQAEETLQRRSEFERLVAEISSLLAGSTSQQIDHVIDDALARLGSFSQTDRAFLFRASDDGQFISNTHEWCAEGISPQIEILQNIPRAELPWFFEQLDRLDCIVVNRLDDLPPEAQATREILERQSIQSLTIIPIASNNKLVGFMGFDAVKQPREWTEEDKNLLRLIGETFVHVIERQQVEEALHESERALRSTLDGLPSHIALIDETGEILLINQPWIRFAEENGSSAHQVSVGHNYLEVCDRVEGPEAEQAQRFAQGIRDVLAGRVSRFEEEYPCHSPEEERWFVGYVIPYQGEGPRRAVIAHEEITRIKLAQEGYHKAQAFLEAVIENSPAGVVVAEAPDAKLCIANQEAIRIFSQQLEEAIKTQASFADYDWPIYSPDRTQYRPNQLLLFRALSHGEVTRSKEVLIIHDSGEERWLSTNATPIRDANGNIIAGVVIFFDITEKKLIEDALRKSEERFREILNRMSIIPVQGYDSERRVIYWNSASEAVYGYSKEEALGQKLEDLIIPEDMRQNVINEVIRWYEEGVAIPDGELVLRDKDNQPVYVYSSHMLYITPSGEQEMYCVDVDLRLLRQMEEERERLKQAIEQADEAIIITGTDSVIHYVNPAFERITGYRRDEAIGQKPNILNSGLHEDEFFAQMYRTLKSGEPWLGRITNKRKNGELFTEEASISPVRDTSGEVVSFVAVKRDITQEIRLEEQVRQAQKMESVGRLAGGVAHDFNNMLSVILGHAEMGLLKIGEDDPTQLNLEEIKKAANRSADLTRQLLAFARKQTVSPQILNLNETIEGMLKMLQRLIGDNIHLNWAPGEELWLCRIDPSQVDQILVNLCVNASDAIERAGRITIETSNATLSEEYCRSHLGFVPGEYVKISVSDDGHGMDAETQAQIFDPFFTTKGPSEGTGLGLATVYGNIKQNKGFINLYSEVGFGTTFTIYLPRYLGQAEIQAEQSEEAVIFPENRQVLLVEDEEALITLAQSMLEKLGFQVIAAQCPNDAIEKAEQLGSIDLLITDVMMPEMNGRELEETLLSFLPHLKTLYMSGYPSNVIAQQGILDEGVKFIQKPFSLKQLADKLRQVIDLPAPEA